MPLSDSYSPRPAPGSNEPEISALSSWMEDELSRIASSLQEFTILKLFELNAAPAKPRDGMLVYADGTNWNPGGGEGVYARIAGSWTKL